MGIQTIEKIVDVPVVKQVDVPQVTTIEKIVEVPHVQTVEKIVEVPMVGQTLQGAQTSTEVALPPIRQQAPAETVTVNEIGPDLPAEAAPQVIKQAPAPAPAPAPAMPAAPAPAQYMA